MARSGSVDKGIARAWREAGLDDVFRAFWEDDAKSPRKARYEPLSHGEARPNTPHPYAVVEVVAAPITGHSSGRKAGDQQEYRDASVQIRIHAKDDRKAKRSAKSIAQELATKVDAAIGPPNKLDMSPGLCHLNTVRVNDFFQREGDSEAFVVLLYEMRVEASNSLGFEQV